ncbi:hypothetical protein A9K75_08585 [Campylobacter fetus subsp. testudinum]|uniref:recombinase RecT n=1 Tax=Campylobacter fetus TaxID=196 RepID=UPI000818B70B|nr:recombinase RecT [Campylobacter fetus]OCR99058.1 hypothetical protein A9K75_08585 [Campylobacter fetus subsp. testudinum]
MAFNLQNNNNANNGGNGVAEIRRLVKTKSEALLSAFGGNQNKVIKFESNLLRLYSTTTLKDCTPISVFGAAIQAAYLNLDLDPILGQAYVIARKGKATFQTGYQGLIELIRRSGELQNFNTVLVYDKEDFSLEYTIDGIKFKHTPKSPSNRGNKIVGGYLIAQLKNGGTHFEWMWREEIDTIAKASTGYNTDYSPWKTSFEAMAKKTIIRRAAKYLPKTIELAKVISIEESQEIGKNINYETAIDGEISFDENEPVVNQITGEVEETKNENTLLDNVF